MRIKKVIDDAKARVAFTQRRARAIKDHGSKVAGAGVEAARQVAAVAAHQLQHAVQTQKAAALEAGVPLRGRARALRGNAVRLAGEAREEIGSAVREGYATVRDRLQHVTAVTHKEQALENKLGRRAKKAAKAAEAG